MHCKEWEESVALHVGGDLPAEAASAVEQHLAGCSGCQVLWSGLRESLEWLHAAHVEPLPPSAYTAVRGRVMAELSSRRPAWCNWGTTHWAAGLAAAAAVVFVALTFWPLPKIEPLPRVALAVPPAPELHAASTPAPAPRAPKPHHPANHQPLMVRLVTDDPNVVIYWIAE